MCCRELWFILSAFLIGSFAGPVSEEKTANELIVTDKSATIFWKSAEVSDEYFPEFALLLSRTDDLSSLSARVTEDNFLTFDDLEPNKSYIVKVYGLSSAGVNESKHHQIEFTTKSSGPDTPTDLTFANVDAVSFDLKWSFPESVKIVPFKFLVQVTETERHDKEHCCQEFPQMEIPYSIGQTSFETKVEGLNPASKYTVSVLGKRIGLGEPAIVHVQTRLPRLGLEGETFIVQVPVNNFRTIHQHNATNESLVQLYRPLFSGPKMLVALTTEEVPEEKTGVKDGKLSALIRSTFNSSFFVIMDLDKDVKPIVKLGSEGAYKGKWGENTWKFNNGTACYRLAGVQVSKYGQTYGVDYYDNGEAFQPTTLLSPFTYGGSNLDCYRNHGHI